MNFKLYFLGFSIILCSFCSVNGQNISIKHQFNGHVDFVFIGNTMNLGENNETTGCETLLTTSSAANLNLTANQVIKNAYLYWAGSGLGDLNVKLNGLDINAQITYSNTSSFIGLPYFSAYADVTNQVISTGNSNYTVSDLDITQTLLNETGYCDTRTNFAGWAMVVVYEDSSLPLNQINIYEGLESIPDTVTINLNNLNVIDNTDAKIGFIAWEGDADLAIDETLQINGHVLSNPPLNPVDNAFNGTNSFTGSDTLYNMDLDVYSIQNNINVGDQSALIQLSSGQDVVLINVVATKLNSELPDATIALNNIIQTCDSKTITLNYTVSNLNCTLPLPAGTPIAIYADGQLVGQTQTAANIPVNGNEIGQLTVTLPTTIPTNFTLKLVVDDNGTGAGIIIEIVENNNSTTQSISQWESPKFNTPEPVVSCNEGYTKGTFNFSSYEQLIKVNPTDVVKFYETYTDAENQINPITNTTNYVAIATPKVIFVRIQNTLCYTITSIELTTKNCPPTVYNFVSANGDGMNDSFFIDGLRTIFLNYDIEIYNRWGRLIWKGDNQTPDWDGNATIGFKFDHELSPKGTYYYILNLHDIDYPKPFVGWLYLTK